MLDENQMKALKTLYKPSLGENIDKVRTQNNLIVFALQNAVASLQNDNAKSAAKNLYEISSLTTNIDLILNEMVDCNEG